MSTAGVEDIVLGAVFIASLYLGHPRFALWAFIALLINVGATYGSRVVRR